MKLKIAGLLLTILISTTFIQAQTIQDSSVVSIETVDGNEFVGEIIEESPLSVVLKT